MSTTLAQSIELPAGYAVLERLGAGGYGEVWKATAPGGVEKAIKIVFGHCDEGMAERELKSLERIKSVRHPFVLTIERYEIVNSRLVIVTELADMSLSDSFQQSISEGHPGIPREQLVSYLWDAAEGLDCLVEQHALQHLDIKPENLLLVGDHIKVADFGLVKELASKTRNSMMGGMTPLYSAPEIYDDNPSSRSDQYSLAIVYQHMLTGSLPFPGRTPAQLAKQHTLSEPNLKPLSEADRQIVRRALAKDPAARFTSCREFVSALRAVGHTAPVSINSAPDEIRSGPTEPVENDDTKSVASRNTEPVKEAISRIATQVLPENRSSVASSPRRIQKKEEEPSSLFFPIVTSEIEDVEVPAFELGSACQTSPTLFVGVGGIGISMLREVCEKANAAILDPAADSTIGYLAIDTDRETLNTASRAETESSLSSDDVLHIPLRRPKQYREASQELLQWVSRRWLYNIPRSLQTRGFRPLGRIAVVDHAETILTTLQARLHQLSALDASGAEKPRSIRVVFLAGMSGGTGGGTIIDLAQAVRSLSQELALDVTVHAVLGCTFSAGGTDSLAAANMYSLMTEINHAQNQGNCGESPPSSAASRYESPRRPFDEIYTVAVPSRSDSAGCELTLESVANYLMLEAGSNMGSLVDSIRSTAEGGAGECLFRNFSCISLGQLANSFVRNRQQRLIKDVVHYWLAPGSDPAESNAQLFGHHANSKYAQAVLSQCLTNPSADSNVADDAIPPVRTPSRTAEIELAASALVQFLETSDIQGGSEQSTGPDHETQSVSERVVETLCAILGEGKMQDRELGQLLSTMLREQVNEIVDTTSTVDPSQLASCALSLFEESPLACGCRRFTALITPKGTDDTELLKEFTGVCPTVAHYTIDVADTYLVREGCQLSPLHLGARLAEDYPDIDEAAGRLHARNDVSWRDLRSIGLPRS